MAAVSRFRLHRPATREHALRWVSHHYYRFPHVAGVGPELFHTWRFVQLLTTGEIVFANGRERCIYESELRNGRQ